jgi:hypothetical protein
MEDSGLFLVCPFGGNRIPYVVKEVFKRRLGLAISIIKPSDSISWSGFKIGYGCETGDLILPFSGILNESGSLGFKAVLDLDYKKSELISPIGHHTSGDLLGLIFWLISRYEEYSKPDLKDEHGRFPTAENTLVKSQLHSIPLVEHWLDQFFEKELRDLVAISKPKPKLCLSFDIDNITAFRHKGIVRNVGGALKDLCFGNWVNIWNRIATLNNFQTDPYKIWEDTLINQKEVLPASTCFFFWVGDYGPFDKGLSWMHPEFALLTEKISGKFQVGLHPSYKTFDLPGLLKIEKKRLESRANQVIIKSRFHYLRFRLPVSYEALVETDIEEDYSMGFHDQPGFRAGTGNPFTWYNLTQEKPENLTIYPFSMMDSAYRFHLKKDFQTFLQESEKQWKSAKSMGFPLNILFHNEHLSWKGWENAVEQIKKQCF